jgi:putative transposase
MRDIAQYIELRYNTKRRHSGLQYKTPKRIHDEYLNRQLAA